jgi:hypothetical protein
MTTAILSDATRIPTRDRNLDPRQREATLDRVLRAACLLCFVGHGAWGVITKAGWLPFYAVFDIGPEIAWKTMPLVGGVDIALGVAAVIFPCRALFAYLSFWTLFTALLRPLAGMGFWEFLERGGNYGPPLALLWIAISQRRGWFERLAPAELSAGALRGADWLLRVSIAFLLIGHGGFALVQEKKILIEHWQALGVAADATFLHALGAAEIAAGVAVLFKPAPALLIAIAVWKIGNELLYPLAGGLRDTWEWVERGGDYTAPFALIVVRALRRSAAPAAASDSGARNAA